MNIALVKAGGRGTRMGAEVPKQFVSVGGKPIIVYTLEVFESHPNIDAVVVVCLEGWQDVLSSYLQKYGITKVESIVAGGETSLRSIREGIREVARLHSRDDVVLIHDANRPLLTEDIVSDVIAQRAQHGSAVAAIPVTDEVMENDGKHMESEVFLDHKRLFRIQTPDAYEVGFAYDLLESATDYQLDNIGATNVLTIAAGGKIHFAQGSELNIRLTRQEDILLMESLLYLRNKNDREI